VAGFFVSGIVPESHSRRDFWMFALINGLISFVLYGGMYTFYPMFVVKAIYDLVVIIPPLSLMARRCSIWTSLGVDASSCSPFAILGVIGATSELLALGIVGGLGGIAAGIYLLVLYCQKGDEGENRFGPAPAAVPAV